MSKDKTLTANLTDIFVEEVHNDSHVGKRLLTTIKILVMRSTHLFLGKSK